MKKLFSIFCCLLLSASMATHALNWSWTWAEFDHNNVDAKKIGDDGDNVVYQYNWWRNKSGYPCTRIVVCFIRANGVTWEGDLWPAKGNYSVNWQEGSGRIACYQTTNNYSWVYDGSRWYSMVYNSSGTKMCYYSGDFKFDEGDDGLYIYSTNLVLANSGYTQLINNGTTNSITIGTPATYYNVNVVSNNNSLGTVTSNYKSGYVYANNRSQEYKKNSVYTLTATETDGVFVEWQKNGSRISTSNVVDVTIDGNATYTAVFEAASGGTITVNAGSNGQVKLDNGSWGSTFSNTYSGGQSATIAAQANEGYLFYQWTDNASVTSTTNPYNFTVTSTNTYTASFKRAYTITTGVNDEAFGSVGITEPYSNGKYYEGQSITITATPANSFTSFVKWQKNGVDYAGGASINVTVNANDTYTAFFSGRNIIEVDIPNATYVDRNATYSLRGNSNGTSSESSGYYVDVQFNASTDALYSVDGIKHNGSNMSFTTKTIEGLEQPCGNRKITNLACYNATGDVYMFKIHWTQPWGEDSNDTYPNDRTINANQQAAYDDDLGAIYVYGYTKEYEWNGQATLRAMGMYFVTGQRCSDDIKIPVGTYEINCSGDPGTVMSYQSGMDKDLSGGWAQTQGVEHGYYLLDKGTVTVTKSGSTYTINVNAKNSYGNDLISTMTIDESVISGTIPNYTLNVTTDGHGTAKVYRYDCSGNENLVSNSGSYKQGSYFKLEATPASGYAFDYWTIDGVDEHFTNNPEILDGLYDNAVVTAHFKTAVMHTITINTPTNGTIIVMDGETTINNGDQVEEGTVLTVTATPATGYHFDSWTNDGAASVTVNSDVTIGAKFAINTYTVTVAKNEDDWGTISATSVANVPYGTVITTGTGENANKVTINGTTVTATPAAATAQYTYGFNSWTNGTETVIGYMTVTANFTRETNTYDITFKNADGTTLKKLDGTTDAVYSVAYGETPAYDGATPTKDADSEYTYTFNGWDNEIVAVTTAATYTATYSTTKVQYTLTWDVNGGNELTGTYTSGTIDWGTAINKPADPTKAGYTFNGWDADNDGTADVVATTMPTSDVTYKALWILSSMDALTLLDKESATYYDNFQDYDGVDVETVTYTRNFTAGNWSTLCLPFDVTEGNLILNGLSGQVFAFQHATGNANVGSQVLLYFIQVSSLEAGVPYLVRTRNNKSNFTFENVTINTEADTEADITDLGKTHMTEGTIALVGTLRKGTLPKGDKHYMGLMGNKIYYPGENTTVPAYRAYFYDSNPSGVQQRVRIVVDGEDMGELLIDNGELLDAGGDDRAPRKYIRNGNLYIEREGVTYDAQGKRM